MYSLWSLKKKREMITLDEKSKYLSPNCFEYTGLNFKDIPVLKDTQGFRTSIDAIIILLSLLAGYKAVYLIIIINITIIVITQIRRFVQLQRWKTGKRREDIIYSSCQINTHLVFPLFPENEKSIPIILR